MRNFACVDFKILHMDTFIRLHNGIQRLLNSNLIRIIKLFVNINIHHRLCGCNRDGYRFDEIKKCRYKREMYI